MYCEHCGQKMAAPDAAFCEHCGQPVSQATAEKAGLNIKVTGEKVKEKLKDIDLSEAKKVKDKVTKKGKAVLSDARNLKKATKPLSKKAKTIIGGVAGVVVVAVLLFVLIPKLGIGKEPILVVEDGALVYYDNISDEEGIVIDANYGDLRYSDEAAIASDIAALSCYAQFSEDGNYVFYLTGDSTYTWTHDLMQVDLKKAKKDGQRYAAKLIASDVEEFSVAGDTVLYEQQEKNTDSEGSSYTYPVGFYSIKDNANYQLTDNRSWSDYFDEVCISADGKFILYGEDDALYFYDATTHQRKSLAANAAMSWCAEDLSEIVYCTEDKVYLATTEAGEILGTECLFTVPLDDPYIYYADKTMVSYWGYNSNGEDVSGIYKDGITTTLSGESGIMPLKWTSSVKSSDINISSILGDSEVWGIEFECEGDQGDSVNILDSNLQSYETSVSGNDCFGISGYAWDHDRNIIYVCFELYNDNNCSYDLYAYTMEDGTITGEKLIATDCADQICYDSGSQCLFYYDDYDEENARGTLCAVFDGEYQCDLVRNAYVESWSLEGLQFNSENAYVLCWADVEDRVGTLYALDMSADSPAVSLGTNVNMDSWGVYDDKIMFIGNYNEKNGGTLFSFDGKEIARERENVMAVITDTTRYSYLETES